MKRRATNLGLKVANLAVGVDFTCLLASLQVIEQLVQIVDLPCMRRLRLNDQRLTHQANDEAVALVGAHALLQLEQDGVLVSGVAALRLPIVGMSAAQGPERRLTCSQRSGQGSVRTCRTSTFDSLDRVQGSRRHQRGLKGPLLRRTHHHVELRPACLRVSFCKRVSYYYSPTSTYLLTNSLDLPACGRPP